MVIKAHPTWSHKEARDIQYRIYQMRLKQKKIEYDYRTIDMVRYQLEQKLICGRGFDYGSQL